MTKPALPALTDEAAVNQRFRAACGVAISFARLQPRAGPRVVAAESYLWAPIPPDLYDDV